MFKASVTKEKALYGARKFIYDDLFAAFIALTVFLCWYFRVDNVGFYIVVLSGCAVLLLEKDIIALTPIILMAPMLVSQNQSSAAYSNIFYLAIPIGICFIAHFFIYRPKIKFGKLFIPQLIVSVAMLVCGCTVVTKSQYLRALPMAAFLGFGVLFLYFILTCYADSDNRRDKGLYFAKTLVWVGVLVALEMIGSIIQTGGLASSIAARFELGWGGANNISVMLLLTAPMCFYLSTRYKYGWPYVILGLFQYLLIFATFSRAGQIGAVITLPFSLIFALKYADNFKYSFVSAVVFITVLLLSLTIRGDYFDDMFKIVGFFEKGFDGNGRTELYLEAWECFKAHPIFGVGMGHDGPNFVINQMGLYWFHSTFFQVLANMGLVGISAFTYLYIVRYKLICKGIKTNRLKVFLLIAMIGFEIQSLADTATFSPIPFMMAVTILTVVAETDNGGFTGYPDGYNRPILSGLFIKKI